MKRQALPDRAEHVQGAAGENQIVLANGIAEHDLDEPADASERPVATTTLLITVRVFVPGTAANTMVPLSVSLPLAAAAGMASAAEILSAVPAASSAHDIARFIVIDVDLGGFIAVTPSTCPATTRGSLAAAPVSWTSEGRGRPEHRSGGLHFEDGPERSATRYPVGPARRPGLQGRGRALAPARGAHSAPRLIPMNGSIQVNKFAAPLRRVLVTTLGYSHGSVFLPSAWNGSWNDAPNNPSAVGAVSTVTCAIRAASALVARGRTSCPCQISVRCLRCDAVRV